VTCSVHETSAAPHCEDCVWYDGDTERINGYYAGNYAEAYETRDYDDAVAGLRGTHGPGTAYHVGFTLGFFASYEPYEVPPRYADAHSRAYASPHGARLRELGLASCTGADAGQPERGRCAVRPGATHTPGAPS
jgi:hypothetical protein